MKKTIIIALLFIASPACAQITLEERKELKKVFAKKFQVKENQVESTLKENAVNAEYRALIDEITTRIRRQKIDEAKAYQPTKAEIIAELKKRSASNEEIIVSP